MTQPKPNVVVRFAALAAGVGLLCVALPATGLPAPTPPTKTGPAKGSSAVGGRAADTSAVGGSPTKTTRQALSLGVRIQGPAPSAAAADFERHVRACLAPAAGAAPLVVTLRWAHVGAQHQVVMDVAWGTSKLGARLLQGPQPGALLEAAAVATCVALDVVMSRPEAVRQAMRRGRAFSTRRARRRVEPAPKKRGPWLLPDGWQWGFRLGVLGQIGMAPAETGGVNLAVSARDETISGRIGLRVSVPAQLALAEGSVRSSVGAVVLMGCWHWGALAVCPLGSVGVRWSESTGLAQTAQARSLDGEVGLRVGGDVDVWRGLRVGGWLEGSVPWVRTRFFVDDAVVWERSGVGFAGGVEVGF